MKLRCTGAKTPGHFTSFECVLDEGHDGFCKPYKAPDVDEWRAAIRLTDDALRFRRLASEWQVDCDAAHDREDKLKADVACLQAENDALRAIIESGAGVAKDATGLLAKVLRGDYQWPNGVAWAVGEAHRILTGGPPDGVDARAKEDAGRGPDAEGTPRV